MIALGGGMHTRSVRRRFFATVIDVVFAFLVTMIAVYPFAKTLDSPLRVTGGLWFLQRCAPGAAYTAPGVPFSIEGWNSIGICDTQSNGVFPSREAIFYAEKVNGAVKTFKTLSIPLNSKNEAYFPWFAETLFFIPLIILAALFEGGRFRATPGKMALGLFVTDSAGRTATVARCLFRNTLKYVYFAAVAAMAIATNVGLYSPFARSFVPGEPKVSLDFSQVAAAAIVPTAVGVVWLGLLASTFLPWSRAGRGLYDRLAHCVVQRHP
jgi:RDD family